MKKVICLPTLDHFSLITKDMMLAFFRPTSVKYTTLLHLGAAVLLESKRAFLEDYYFGLLPSLYALETVTNAKALYVDTGP